MNPTFQTVPALFVSPVGALGQAGQTPGGVQLCTAEYMDVLKAAGFNLSVMPVGLGGTLAQRVQRKLSSRPYQLVLPHGFVEGVLEKIKSTGSRFVFLNLVDLAPLAKILREKIGTQGTIVLLSHGAHSADELHAIRYRSFDGQTIQVAARDERRLGAQLMAECDQRRYLDHVFCLSEFDLALERWIGAKNATWLPRLIPNGPPLDWQPQTGRMGFVGTLDHPPNLEGLLLFLDELAKHKSANTTVRIIGGPDAAGQKIARQYAFVNYLGRLNDADLEKEAATWCCAVHPLFCYPRGCSTKLAVLLRWQIPVVTTPAGRRGYIWKDGSLAEADTPLALGELALRTEDPHVAASIRSDVARIVKSSPTVDELALMARQALQINQPAPGR